VFNGLPNRDSENAGSCRLPVWLPFLLVTCLQQVQAAGLLVVASSNDLLYSRFIDAFTASLTTGISSGDAVDTGVIYLDDRGLTPVDIAERRLVITVGTRAAKTVADRAPEVPVLHTVIPESVYRNLTKASGACPSRSAIFIDQPLARQARLAQAMFPGAIDYGVLLGPTSEQRLPEIDALKTRADRHLVVISAGYEADIARATNGLLNKIDLLLAVNDPLVLNRENAKWLLYSAYQHRLPVIGFSRAYVLAGAAGAVFSAPEQMARQAGEIVQRYLTGATVCLPAAGFPAYFSVAVNQSVCSSLGGDSCDEQALGTRLKDEESGQ